MYVRIVNVTVIQSVNGYLFDEVGEAADDVASHDCVCFNVVETQHTTAYFEDSGACLAKSIMDKYLEY